MTTMLRILAALLVPALLAGPARAQGAPASGTGGAAAALRVVSAQRLPSSPGPRPQSCRHLFPEVRTPAGRLVSAAGWAVTREAAFGPYQAVSFVRAAETGTSGTCELLDGSIGIFRGAELVAIVYAPAGGSAVGSIAPLGPDAVRIWNGDFLSQPVADLHSAAGGGFAIRPLAAEESVCGGRAAVPNVYGRPIDQARILLMRHGWAPDVPATREGRDERVADLVRRGVPEVEGCSGTGFGFCRYGYRGTAGTLFVATAGDGELPFVSGYGVTCTPG